MSKIILKVRNLTTKLRVDNFTYTVVDDISFQLKQGKTLALVGESGCGKTMTALSILRILPTPPALFPTGEILFDEVNLLTLPEKKMRQYRGSRISMIFQNPMHSLNPVFTIRDQLYEIAYHHLGLNGDQATEKIHRSLEDVHFSQTKNVLSSYPHQLSGGMLQRVMIAMALMCSPDILIADEPTTALDVTIQAQILNLLQELQQKKGMAILLITHDMGVVAEMAHEVIVMYAAQKIETGPVLALFDSPSHPYTQALFQSRPNNASLFGKWPTIEGAVPSIGNYPGGCRFHPRCSYCFDFCKTEDAPLFFLPNQEHEVKCWLYDKKLMDKLKHE